MRSIGLTNPLLNLTFAACGGALWEWAGMPLGWLMGAALVTGGLAILGLPVYRPQLLGKASLAVIGCSVGLAISPNVAGQMVSWAPVMVLAAAGGIACAAMAAPLFARLSKMSLTTSFFSLLPGGVIEMSSVGERYGADRTAIASLHAIRVALVVGLLPLALFTAIPHASAAVDLVDVLSPALMLLALLIALGGGWLGERFNLPAAWLLGALIATGLVTGLGALDGSLPQPLLAVAQIFVGVTLGARFHRESLTAIPRALAVGTPVLIVLMAAMAVLAGAASLLMPHALPTLILCFSIGGMAEMVLTARAFDQDVALVAAFQAVRGLTVNLLAGSIWTQLSTHSAYQDIKRG